MGSDTTPKQTVRIASAGPSKSSQPRNSSPLRPPSTRETRPLTQTKRVQGDLRNWFGNPDTTQSRGKENARVVSTSSAKEVTPVKSKDKAASKPVKKTTPPPRKKKRVIVSDDDADEDFVMDEDKQESEEESSYSAAEEEGDGSVEADGLVESDAEEIVVEKKAKKYGGWGNTIKAPKKAPVNLGSYKTGIKPLELKMDKGIAAKNLSEDLPPLSDVEAMFDHLVSRVPDLVKVVERLNGRKLRVATMCSGTESPVLALNMIAKAIKVQHGLTLSFDHVFSCEIEPFKQAYIERNFSPPILFRDVTELGKNKAHTAYGSMAKVPGNVDLLIAGTSCVDYSNLNNQQQSIEGNGESGRTFRGMIQWVKKHQPPIVILENVCNAPWDKVVEYFGQIDYDAQYARLDTKEFYIPHTRTRVYLFATPRGNDNKSHLADKWVMTVKDMKRPWSSSFENFLLHTDDPNIHRARLDLAAAKAYKDGTQRKPTDWNRCESRHQFARHSENLGILRPLTSWQEAGVCKGLDWTWNDWLLSQTERVLDLLEISTLRMAKDGIDSGFKACIWNVSQNVDRQTGSNKTALAPCLTPNMIPWVTNRGGPVTGREALALQGIPVRELLLTSENEDQLADLAGNAMTTTVVGASMIAALRVALDRLTPGENAEGDATQIEQDAVAVDDEATQRIVGDDKLETHELDLAKVETANLQEMLDLALQSSRHCQCEGQSGTASPIEECTACGYKACKACGGRPDHHYAPCGNDRVEPTEFERKFKELLPMRVKVAGLTEESLSVSRAAALRAGKGEVSDKDWSSWSSAVVEGVMDAEFRFRYLKRGYTWTAVYEAPHASLDLFLHPQTPEWRLTIKAPPTEAVNSRLRNLVLHPVARLRFDIHGSDVLCGPWEVCVPSKQSFDIQITGRGETVPSWHALLGLQGDLGKSKRWSKLEVSVPAEASRALDRDLSGTYELLPKCGQAMTSLHKKISTGGDDGLAQIFFFFDPTRCGEPEEDCFVFSTRTERLDAGVERPIIASLSKKWRESAKEHETVRLDIRGGWVKCDSAHLTAVGGNEIAVVADPGARTHEDSATFAVPPNAASVTEATESQGCQHASAILACQVPLDPGHSESMWRNGAWGEIDLMHAGNATFANLAWITERIPLLGNLAQWNMLSEDASGHACERCAPRPPKIHWIKREGKLNKNGNKTRSPIVAFEDKYEAGRYEHALKHRPSPFVLQLRLDDSTGRFRIGLNIVSLAHRALSRLPLNAKKGTIKLSWKLTPGQVADVPEPPRVFILPSNKLDPQHAQPRGFQLDLRKEQLRSLWWMLEREKCKGETHTFIEEEISEAALPSLGWRAEGKAERPVMIRGGVIADQVGYGKTIISLALIAESKGLETPEPAPQGSIELKATLVVVPGHLSKQWPSEITRFTGKMFNTVVIQNMADLNKLSIADLSKADIIVLASEIFESDAYWQRFEYLSAQPDDWLNDKNGGRFFSDRLDTALASLEQQTALLAGSGGAESALKTMEEAQREAVKEAEKRKEAHKTANFGKRMKGQAYRNRYDAADGKKMPTKDSDKWEASGDEEEDDELPLPVPTFRKPSGTSSFGSSTVKGNHKLLAAPVFHMFRFRRVIADEFTYLASRSLASILRLKSCYKWVLSGTPPVGDFAAIRSIAAFMGIHLGVDDDGETPTQSSKARAKEQTQAEKFHAFREVHSQAWHRRRDDLAQEFLNTFVRQNIAEIDDIPTMEHVHEVKLPASEGAVYLELEHHLQALDMQARKETKFKNVTIGDRNARLEEALSDSKTAEEALLKRCCHFTLDLTDKELDAKSAAEACQHISSARSSQLTACEEDLYRSMNIAVGYHLYIKKKGHFGKSDPDAQPFRDFVIQSYDTSTHQGDKEAAERLVQVLEKCGFRHTDFPSERADGKGPEIEKGASVDDVKWSLREQTHLLRRLSKELVARVRSLRFFDVVRKLQLDGAEAKITLEGSGCSHKPSTHPGVEMAVLSCCGHVACHACMLQAADQQACIRPADCRAAVRYTNVVKVSSLGIEGELSSGRFGAKLQRLVDLIHTIPPKERILVFTQWDDLANKVGQALEAGGISHVIFSGSVKQRALTLANFQSTDAQSARVLLLKMNDASAAGSNLTTANHAIFLGPLFTSSLYNYRAVETQAIGRVRRYGQTRKVHIHRLLALDTIDMRIFNERRAEMEAKPDYVPIPQGEYVAGKASGGKKQQVLDAVEVD
ncbi:hypothetical protein BD324DRAFT_131575 [Kockovaella imperatae]|uniref:Helicase C-terminal domain-containing protein n=1 Tax=Kockovaella imperatae TaxID=4999 RepID=A0A1Y1UB23_9TREE|nr:hypothetical protein BD324DRAFT_131575 [Kockovaella imperatae]ORX34744.1 hypothetical protein BD324DRAFT_131575 [Kockovaella imperatae]